MSDVLPDLTESCKEVKCEAVEDPICVKLKHQRREFSNQTTYIHMINKCELGYIKCHKDLEAVIVPMKYCDHQKSMMMEPFQSTTRSKRVKRSAIFDKHQRNHSARRRKTSRHHRKGRDSRKRHRKHRRRRTKNKNRRKEPSQSHKVKPTVKDDKKGKKLLNKWRKMWDTYKNATKANTDSMNATNSRRLFEIKLFGRTVQSAESRDISITREFDDIHNKHGTSEGQSDIHSDSSAGDSYLSNPVDDASHGCNSNAEPMSETANESDDKPACGDKTDSSQQGTDYEYHSDTGNEDDDASGGTDNNSSQKASDSERPSGTDNEDVNTSNDDKGCGNKSDEKGSDSDAQTPNGGTDYTNSEKYPETGNDSDNDDNPCADSADDSSEKVTSTTEEPFSSPESDNDVNQPDKNPEEEIKTSSENQNPSDTDCPKHCPPSTMMACARCIHGVYRTFLSICHVRQYACKFQQEQLELVAQHPCVLSAPNFIGIDNSTMPHTMKGNKEYDDKVLRFISCRQAGYFDTPQHNTDIDPQCRIFDRNEMKI